MQYDVVHPVWKKWELSEINFKKRKQGPESVFSVRTRFFAKKSFLVEFLFCHW